MTEQEQNNAVPPGSEKPLGSVSFNFKRGLSRFSNFWRSGRTGKTCIIALSVISIMVVANWGRGSEEQRESQDIGGPAKVGNTVSVNDRRDSIEPHVSPAAGKQAKIKTVGFWVCNQCGTQLESRTRPTGRCPSRNNAPHAWVMKGETQVVDYGQKISIWQCRKCFQVLTLPSGAPPSGMRCPKEKNSPHGWDKIGER